MGKSKPYADGGGLCSPGRWASGHRLLPRGLGRELMEIGRNLFEDAVAGASGGSNDCLGLMLKLAAGRIHEVPLQEKLMVRLRILARKTF